MGHGITCANELKKLDAAIFSSWLGFGEYPSVTMCIVVQKIGPQTDGLIPIGGNLHTLDILTLGT